MTPCWRGRRDGADSRRYLGDAVKDISSSADVLAGGSEWLAMPLGEIVDVLDSKRKPIAKRDRIAGPYPCYGATGVLDWVQEHLFDEPLVLIAEDGAK